MPNFTYSKSVTLAKLGKEFKAFFQAEWGLPFSPVLFLPIQDFYVLPNENKRHIPPAIAFHVDFSGFKRPAIESITRETLQLRSFDWVLIYVYHPLSVDFLNRVDLQNLGAIGIIFPRSQGVIPLWWDTLPESWEYSANWVKTILSM